MTKHLYYQDSYLTEFTANVLEQSLSGGKPAVVLDQTAFYPDSGGQPCDTGFLNGARVVAVEEDAAGNILHILESAPASGEVRGRIDWARRFDHMQQHTGQHILSQAFLQVAGGNTLSFHLGQQSATIDLDLPQPDPAVLQDAEELASRVVFEDRPVNVLNVRREELGALGVRKESQREGDVRVIDIEGFDRSPCGGTHVHRTGEIGLIFILGSERYKGGVRVEFACGGRVLPAFRKDHAVLRELGKLLSSHPHQLPEVVEKLLQERVVLQRDKTHMEDRLLEMEAQELLRQAEPRTDMVVVCRSFRDRRIENLKALARKVTAAPRSIAVFWALAESAQLVVARGPDLAADCGKGIQQVTAKLGGKGGGRPELAQAGGIAIPAIDEWSRALIEYFQSCVREQERSPDR